uniref:Uncharacterized protein n=1 Tax=Anguilla anguilla TaxID=7936 RepID=A0A0E9TKQ5_ANGAN
MLKIKMATVIMKPFFCPGIFLALYCCLGNYMD